ncbi:magnesium/cobalt transporter CorA [Flexithrix dorotheae]|uniref:magnesium/cobalt transporter CorA n=1 Tax=Flexithrix dorotheae TaxID=70993 RepID=UPI0003A52753|nr:magnesium/cobalt transporter CorA [Flexithrix dorotheae]
MRMKSPINIKNPINLKNPFSNYKAKIGKAPGSLIFSGVQKQEKVEVEVISYNLEEYKTYDKDNIEGLRENLKKSHVNWVNIFGLHDIGLITKLGEQFDIDPLLLEDVLDVDHLPKVEDYEEYRFLTFKMLFYNEETKFIEHEQVSVILGEYYVIVFQEKRGDIFDVLRERIQIGKGRARGKKSDYLFYLIIDVVVDHYLYIIDNISQDIENLEEELLIGTHRNEIEKIIALKKKLNFLRKFAEPLQESVIGIVNIKSNFIQKSNIKFFNDVNDHLNRVIQTMDANKDAVLGLLAINSSNQDNRLNSIMKTLTIISTIFIPLTFIAGIYGMNFENMPELHSRNGYFYTLGAMVVVGIIMAIFMRKNKWF